jgi:RimJ/RimL family protein N-acetyltransferase
MDDPTPADVPVSRARGFPPRRDLTDGVVLLRSPRRSDAAQIVAGATDPEVVRYTLVPSPYRDEDLDKILTIADEGWSEGTDAVFAVCDAAHPEELLGLLGLHGVELGLEPGGRAEIGYWMRPEGRGRGLMTRAIQVATDWAVHELDLAVVTWFAFVGNDASRRAAERAGYTMEGTLRRGAKHRGALVDTWIGSIVAEDLPR